MQQFHAGVGQSSTFVFASLFSRSWRSQTTPSSLARALPFVYQFILAGDFPELDRAE